MDFIYFFRILFKRKWIIIGAAVLAAAAAYFFTKNSKKEYKSTAQISTGYTIHDEVRVNEENIGFIEADARFNNITLISKSEPVVSLLSYSLIVHDLTQPQPFRKLSKEKLESPAFKKVDKQKAIGKFTQKLEKMEVLSPKEDGELLELLELYGYDYKSLSKKLTTGRLQRTDYWQIEYLSENPELSAFVVNTLFKQFLRYYTTVRDTRSLENIDTLRSIVEKKKQALDYKRSLLTGEGMIDVSIESTGNMDRITNLEKTLTDEKSKQTSLYYELRKVNQRLGNAGASPQNNGNTPVNSNANSELLLLKKTMNETYEAYLKGGSTDKDLLNKYNQLKADYQERFGSNSVIASTGEPVTPATRAALLDKKNDIELDIKASEENIASIQSRISALKGNVIQDASKAATVETMMKEVDLANQEYLEAQKKYSDAVDIGSSFVNNFRLVLAGQPSWEPEPSNRAMMIGMSGVGAALATTLIIVLLAYLDSSIKTPGIFSKVVNLKLISMVNFVNLKKRPLIDIVTKSAADDAADKKRLNVFRESLRKLRYEIERSNRRSFLFTSTKKGMGKTTLIQALSYSLSASKKKVLIIDTNFCNNDLTVQLNADPVLEKIDFDFVASDHATLLEKISSASKQVMDGAGTIFAIGSEGGDYTPSEILPENNILNHLPELTEYYDYIFLEGPPLNDYSDSRELAKYAEGVIAIFSAEHIIKQIDKESIVFFTELGDKFCGSVLNMVEMENVNVT